jgi:hypothetical protein
VSAKGTLIIDDEGVEMYGQGRASGRQKSDYEPYATLIWESVDGRQKLWLGGTPYRFVVV